MSAKRALRPSIIFLRLALAAGFISSIADRFGLWGRPGAPGVAWGDWPHFVQFVGVLNAWASKPLLPAISVVDTVIEAALGLALLAGFYLRAVAWASAVLLAIFAIAMAVSLGVEAPLNYSVFTAAAAAALLAATAAERQDASQAAR